VVVMKWLMVGWIAMEPSSCKNTDMEAVGKGSVTGRKTKLFLLSAETINHQMVRSVSRRVRTEMAGLRAGSRSALGVSGTVVITDVS